VSARPADDLARLRVKHGALWLIKRQEGTIQETASGPSRGVPPMFVAVNRATGATVTDETASGLESKLHIADHGRAG
jgi:hypothetical protein